jgi:hypothetical protein
MFESKQADSQTWKWIPGSRILLGGSQGQRRSWCHFSGGEWICLCCFRLERYFLVSIHVRPIHWRIVHRVLFRCIAFGCLALSHKNGELFHPYRATHLVLNYCPSTEKASRNSEYLKVVKIMQETGPLLGCCWGDVENNNAETLESLSC